MALFWRVFPWDPDVKEGRLFSPSHIPPTTGRGRFDLPPSCSPVLYVAESPEHAIAEAIQPWRNRPLRRPHLVRAGRPLALVGVQMAPETASALADLCQPDVLGRFGLSADRVASRNRRRTRAIAASAWDRGHSGLRWWSGLWGDWHGVVLFTAPNAFAQATNLGRSQGNLPDAAETAQDGESTASPRGPGRRA